MYYLCMYLSSSDSKGVWYIQCCREGFLGRLYLEEAVWNNDILAIISNSFLLFSKFI